MRSQWGSPVAEIYRMSSNGKISSGLKKGGTRLTFGWVTILLIGTTTFLIIAYGLSELAKGPCGLAPAPRYRVDDTCSPLTNIVFLKTHKCASCSVQNILFRYGDSHNLTFAFPIGRHSNYFGHPAPFQRRFVTDMLNRSVNILTHHMRYARTELDLLMPRDTVYVTIVRSPVDLLESLYAYSHFKEYYRMDLETMASNKTRIESILGLKRYHTSHGLNQMSFDLGLNASYFNNVTVISHFVQRLDNEFDFVMVYERMEESLVLLSDLLCWTLQDVVVFKLNARKDQFRSKLSPRTKQNVLEVSKADVLLYEYFEKRFQDRVSAYGVDRMTAKVAELRKVTGDWFRHCVSGLKQNSSGTRVFNGKMVFLYEPKNENDIDCQRMLRDELSYTELLRKKQKDL